MAALERKVVLVTRRTRLEELLLRFVTLEQARFYVEHLGADFGDYEAEHATYRSALAAVKARLEQHGRYQLLDRQLLPNFLFGPDDVVMALGQDGLVANTLKYLDGQVLVGVNPDRKRHDGVLLPFDVQDVAKLLPDVLADRRPVKAVTMAMASLQDGQRLYAVNDLFIGPRSHTSARYELRHETRRAVQSSSGIIVSTGLGSTGWMRSVLAGARAIAGGRVDEAWGYINQGQHLLVTSMMADGGVIFSDGIESDYLAFNSGAKADIGLADRRGRLVA
jgi:NAD kinase